MVTMVVAVMVPVLVQIIITEIIVKMHRLPAKMEERGIRQRTNVIVKVVIQGQRVKLYHVLDG